jgi:hypothetical protein
MTLNRFVSAGFGAVMVGAAAVDTRGPALIAAAAAAVAVLAGLYLRAAATAAVLAVVCAIVLSEPQPMLAALSGLSAAAYLVLRHATITRPTVIGLVGFTAVGVVATTAGTTGLSWLPLLAPVAAVVLFLLLTAPFARDEYADDAAEAERPALGYE